MELSYQEWWALIHGMILGGLFLLAFAGGLAELHALRPTAETPSGLRTSALRLRVGVTSMAVVAWLTVISGTWVVYPWYRDPAQDSPRSTLLADPTTEEWHTFGMEWKEHIAWISPILATVAAFLVWYYGVALAHNNRLRRTTMVVFMLAFGTAAIAGAFGALITKVAPVA
jgi:small-conductance mechanosensitive channel